MRVKPHHAFRIADAHRFQHLQRLAPRLTRGNPAMDACRFRNLLAHCHDRIERVFGILQHKRNARAANVAQLAGGSIQQINPIKIQLARFHPCRGRQQAHDGAPGK